MQDGLITELHSLMILVESSIGSYVGLVGHVDNYRMSLYPVESIHS